MDTVTHEMYRTNSPTRCNLQDQRERGTTAGREHAVGVLDARSHSEFVSEVIALTTPSLHRECSQLAKHLNPFLYIVIISKEHG